MKFSIQIGDKETFVSGNTEAAVKKGIEFLDEKCEGLRATFGVERKESPDSPDDAFRCRIIF